jgi:hypothetical protein
VHSYSNLAKASFTQNLADFVSIFDVVNFLEPFEIFKVQNMLMFLISSGGKSAIDG